MLSNAMITSLVVWYAIFLFSTTFHEAMHAWVSLRGGDNTAYQGGQVSLNPIPHIRRSPFGMILVPLATFFLAGGGWMIGWASAPFNPYWAARHPKRSCLMSLAGPLSHLPIVIFSFTVMYIGLRNGFFGPMQPGLGMYPVATGTGGNLSWVLATVLNVAFRLNLVLFIFNLLPLPPLDGSEVWYLFVKSEAGRLRMRHQAGAYSFAGIMLAWWLFPRVFNPVFSFLVFKVLYGLG